VPPACFLEEGLSEATSVRLQWNAYLLPWQTGSKIGTKGTVAGHFFTKLCSA
jgi:hypothetical protein